MMKPIGSGGMMELNQRRRRVAEHLY
uniref:Uncharacterized protein n=1 Tax=Arundo donax TaxID=35708 RepID=A0A0A8ZQ14_ARUDO